MLYVRPTKVIYIENDPALREILSQLLSELDEIEIIAAVSNAAEALQLKNIKEADAALIDYALGSDSLNGIELGIALRAFNENLGILIYSQFEISNFSKRIPTSMSHGWGFVTKNGSVHVEEFAQALKNVSLGYNISTSESEEIKVSIDERFSLYSRLSERQRATMALAAQGYSPMAIAEKLGISYDVSRQELSRAYRILVPSLQEGMILSTTAILKFISIRQELEGNDHVIPK